MDPVIVQIGPFVLRWYGVMMALTILTGIAFALHWAPRFGIDRATMDRITFWLVIVLFAGARLGYVVSHPAEFRDPLEVLRVWHGGLSSHGAIIAGLAYGYILSRRTGISWWSLADASSWAIPLGHVFVRIGNFMNGELYGDPTALPWGVRFPTAPGAPRHPLQLYELGFALVILGIAWRVARRRVFAGEVWWTIVTLTSLGRIFLDALRGEEHDLWGVLAYGQVVALVFLVVGVWFLGRRPRESGIGQR